MVRGDRDPRRRARCTRGDLDVDTAGQVAERIGGDMRVQHVAPVKEFAPRHFDQAR